MKRYFLNLKNLKFLGLLFLAISVLLTVFGKKSLHDVVGGWALLFFGYSIIAILGHYFYHFNFYSDNSFKVVEAISLPKPRVPVINIKKIAFVPRAMNLVYKQLYMVYKDELGKTKKSIFWINGYATYTLGEVLAKIKTVNPEVEYDEYCNNLYEQFKNTPEKLEKPWQDRINLKRPLPWWLTDVFMFLLLLVCAYLFYYIPTLYGAKWVW